MKVPVHAPDHTLLGLVDTPDPGNKPYYELAPPERAELVPWDEQCAVLDTVTPRVTLKSERIRFGPDHDHWFWVCDDPALFSDLDQCFTLAQKVHLYRVIGREVGPGLAKIILAKLG